MQSMALAKIRPVLGLQPEEASGDCPEKAPASKAADSAQFKNILSVAVSQEQRLGQHGAVRRGAGYDMSDPFMVATSEMDFAGGKRKPLEFVQLNVRGLPCQVIGEASVVAAYLGMVKDESNKVKKPQECWMRFPDGTVKKLLRSRLLPLPTQLPRLNDWAVVVDLHGELERYNGFRGLCGLNAGQDAFWVLFEPNAGGNKSPKPPLGMIPRKNLVALPTSPHGALETQWEAKLRALPSIGHLVDDPGQPGQLEALKDKDDEENEDEEAFTEEEGEEERPEVGDLVTLLPDNKQMGILKALEGTRAEVKLLPSMAPDSLFAPRVDGCALSLLTKSSQEEAEEVALCNICGEANPEEELLICDNFCKSCASTIHIKCLDPPLQKVPEGDWFCPVCLPREKRKAKAKAEPKSKAEAKMKAKAKAKVKPAAKAKTKAKAVKASIAKLGKA